MSDQRPAGAKPPPVSAITIFLTGAALLAAYYELKKGRITNGDLIYFAVLIPSVILHEISHGWLANLWGDDTAKRAGRLTLNPLRHIDPIGTLIIPAALILLGQGIAFAYAKPVPVNVSRMSRNKAMMVGLIGPITNIAISLVAAAVLNVVTGDNLNAWPVTLFVELGLANVVLATFNLIPIPPLDGASVVERFLPQRYLAGYLRFRQFSMLILILVVLNFRTGLGHLFNPAVQLWSQLLPFDVSLG